MDKDKYLKILDRFMPSKQMRRYLATQTLTEQQLSDLIVGSPRTLENKLKWAWGDDKLEIENALDELNLKSGEVFYLTDAWYDNNLKCEKHDSVAPFLSFKQVQKYIIDEFSAEDEDVYDALNCEWHILEKWVPAGKKEFKLSYTYFLLAGEPVYFIKEIENGSNSDLRYSYYCRDLNLPVPFNVGDALNVSVAPFAPPVTAILIEKGDNRDCCCLQILYKDFYSGKYQTATLKHGLSLKSADGIYNPLLSPLYSLTKTDVSSRNEKALVKIQQYLDGDEEKGKQIWNWLNGYGEPDNIPAELKNTLKGCIL